MADLLDTVDYIDDIPPPILLRIPADIVAEANKTHSHRYPCEVTRNDNKDRMYSEFHSADADAPCIEHEITVKNKKATSLNMLAETVAAEKRIVMVDGQRLLRYDPNTGSYRQILRPDAFVFDAIEADVRSNLARRDLQDIVARIGILPDMQVETPENVLFS